MDPAPERRLLSRISPRKRRHLVECQGNIANTQGRNRQKICLAGVENNPVCRKETLTSPAKPSIDASIATPIWAQFTSTSKDPATPLSTISTSLQSKHSNQVESGGIHGEENESELARGRSPIKSRFAKSSERGVRTPVAMRTPMCSESPDKEKKRMEPPRGCETQAVRSTFRDQTYPPLKYPESPARFHDHLSVDAAFEEMLNTRNVPHTTRDKMRGLDVAMKLDFIQKNKASAASSIETREPEPEVKEKDLQPQCASSTKVPLKPPDTIENTRSTTRRNRSRPRSLTLTLHKISSVVEQSPQKKHKSIRSSSRRRSLSRSRNNLPVEGDSHLCALRGARESTTSLVGSFGSHVQPKYFIEYLQSTTRPQDLEVGRLQKLRQLLRNETVEWVDTFIQAQGMQELVQLLHRIIDIEWREEHEDALLHETLACLKALSTTDLALRYLDTMHSNLFPQLFGLLFDRESKGPSEFATRSLLLNLLYTYMTAAKQSDREDKARVALSYLQDRKDDEDKASSLEFISTMHRPRPYRVWCREIKNVTKEVNWIFLHSTNIISSPALDDDQAQDESSYCSRHFPKPHPCVAAAPYIGGVEWEATSYLATHIDLLNAAISFLPSTRARNALRQELQDSGFEKIMGGSLRTCKEKLYPAVHQALSTWIGAAREDGWDVAAVREGILSQSDSAMSSPFKSPVKLKGHARAPKLNLPELNFDPMSDEKASNGIGWL